MTLASVSNHWCFVSLTFLRPAFWDATRAFMLLAVLSCFAGVVLGLSAFTNGTKNRRVRTGGIALVLSGNTGLIDLWALGQSRLEVDADFESFICTLLRFPRVNVCFQVSLLCWLWPSTLAWRSLSLGSASWTGASRGLTSLAGWPSFWLLQQVVNVLFVFSSPSVTLQQPPVVDTVRHHTVVLF